MFLVGPSGAMHRTGYVELAVGKARSLQLQAYNFQCLTLRVIDQHRECEANRKRQALESEGHV